MQLVGLGICDGNQRTQSIERFDITFGEPSVFLSYIVLTEPERGRGNVKGQRSKLKLDCWDNRQLSFD